MVRILLITCWLMSPLIALGKPPLKADPVPSAKVHAVQIPRELRDRLKNWDGSCVLLSCSFGGMHSNDPKCVYLPFQSQYGPPERGGADPQRMARIFSQRGIHGWNVIGKQSIDMARYAVRTGRGCALGFDYEHFQAVWGYDYERKIWFIWDNRYPEFVTEYTEAEFEQMHNRSGRWTIVLERPGDRIPKPSEW